MKYIHKYEGDYSTPQDEFLPATHKEKGVVWTVSEHLRRIFDNISKLVQVSPKNSNFFGECFIVFECQYGGLPNAYVYLMNNFYVTLSCVLYSDNGDLLVFAIC